MPPFYDLRRINRGIKSGELQVDGNGDVMIGESRYRAKNGALYVGPGPSELDQLRPDQIDYSSVGGNSQ
jgi:hypothetical protein